MGGTASSTALGKPAVSVYYHEPHLPFFLIGFLPFMPLWLLAFSIHVLCTKVITVPAFLHNQHHLNMRE